MKLDDERLNKILLHIYYLFEQYDLNDVEGNTDETWEEALAQLKFIRDYEQE